MPGRQSNAREILFALDPANSGRRPIGSEGAKRGGMPGYGIVASQNSVGLTDYIKRVADQNDAGLFMRLRQFQRANQCQPFCVA